MRIISLPSSLVFKFHDHIIIFFFVVLTPRKAFVDEILIFIKSNRSRYFSAKNLLRFFSAPPRFYFHDVMVRVRFAFDDVICDPSFFKTRPCLRRLFSWIFHFLRRGKFMCPKCNFEKFPKFLKLFYFLRASLEKQIFISEENVNVTVSFHQWFDSIRYLVLVRRSNESTARFLNHPEIPS